MKFASSVVTESPVQRAGSSRSAGKCPEMCQAGPRCLGTGTCQQRHPGRSSHTEELAWCGVKVPLGCGLGSLLVEGRPLVFLRVLGSCLCPVRAGPPRACFQAAPSPLGKC